MTFFGTSDDRWIWKHLSFGEWSRAGAPTPRIAGWMEGSTYYQWSTSSQIVVQGDGGVKHALSYTEWQDSGFRSFTVRDNQGFLKLAWDNSIAFVTNVSGARDGGPITGLQWREEGYPDPRTGYCFPGDTVYRYYGEFTIWYAGPTVNTPITYDEWTLIGRPAPEVRNVPPRPTREKDSKDFPSRQAAQDEFNYLYPAYGDVYVLDRDNDRRVCEDYPY